MFARFFVVLNFAMTVIMLMNIIFIVKFIFLVTEYIKYNFLKKKYCGNRNVMLLNFCKKDREKIYYFINKVIKNDVEITINFC